MRIGIESSSRAIRPRPAALRRLVSGVLRAEGRRDLAVTVILGDDPLLRGLNARFRGLDRATDVLSFEAAGGPGESPGEVYLSLDRVAVQARRYRTGPQRELARLLVHGLLHLLGYDHRRDADRARMRRRERQLIRALARPGEPLFTLRNE